MYTLTIVTNGAVIATAVIAVITLIFNFIKEMNYAQARPFRRKLIYLDDFGDYIANYGSGLMVITDIKYYYDKKEVKTNSLVDLIRSKLNSNYNLVWKTFLDNSEIINRTVNSQSEIKLVEIDPQANEAYNNNATIGHLHKELIDIRNRIEIEITYKNVHGIKKTKKF